jgi:hypothetical protein
LLLRDPTLVATVILSALVSVTLFGRTVIAQLRDQLGHLGWYWRSGFRFLTHVEGPQETLRQRLVAFIARHRAISYAIIYFPTLPLTIAAVALGGGGPLNSGEWLAIAGVVVAGLTLIGKMMVVGPSIRYAYILLPFLMARLFAIWPAAAWTLALIEIAYGLIVGALRLRRILGRDADQDVKRMAALRLLLASASEQGPSRIVCDPLRIAEMIQAFDPPPRLKFASFGFTPMNIAFLERFYRVHPRLDIDDTGARELVERYEFDGALIDLDYSKPHVRAALEEVGFTLFGEKGRFALLWRRDAA